MLIVPEIFAIKVESCQKSRRILDVFCPPTFCWGHRFRNLYHRYHDCLTARRLVKFRELTPTAPKVIGANTLNFKLNFKCSPLNFLGTPDPVCGVR